MAKLELLKELFPLTFRGIDYFECNDGWYDIIMEFALKFEPVLRYAPNGYTENAIFVNQVKEKFGTLRINFYTDWDETGLFWQSVWEAASLAEEKSSSICEVCGAAGKLQRGSWVKTLCEVHASKRNSK